MPCEASVIDRMLAILWQTSMTIRQLLLEGRFPLGSYTQFTIFDPKRRLITAPSFQERVVHHAIMNVCEPAFEKWLVERTFACRRGMGRNKCLSLAQWYARRNAFFLKLDMRHYFDSIDHNVLFQLLCNKFKDPRLLDLFQKIIACYSVSEGRGLPIGSLTSQHFANFYLEAFDQFLLNELWTPCFVRYMDDVVIWGNSSKELTAWLVRIRNFLDAKLCLQLKESAYVNRNSLGLSMLGCRVFPKHIELSRRSKRRFQRKLASLEQSLSIYETSELVAQQRATALVAFVTTARVKSWRFRTLVLERTASDGQGHQARASRR